MKSILEQTAHRPFPLPSSPWVMRQSWSDLLFAHWPFKAADLRACVPSCLEIDTYDGSAWVGVVPFSMNDVCPRFVSPMPWISNFLELNVRTYVSKDGVPGVYFFSLDCSNPVAVQVARKFFHLPYFDAQMSLQSVNGQIVYKSVRKGSGEEFSAIYAPEESDRVLLTCAHESLEYFLTERYCLYTTDKKNRLYQGVIHHLPWPLQKAKAKILKNTMLSPELGFSIPGSEPLFHFSKRIDTVEWPLR